MEKRIKITLFMLFMFFGVRQLLIFWDLWAGIFFLFLGLTIFFSKKEDVF